MRRRTTRVYPRVNGETNASSGVEGYSCGLSPRERGNRAAGGTHVKLTGSIPA